MVPQKELCVSKVLYYCPDKPGYMDIMAASVGWGCDLTSSSFFFRDS